MYIVKTKKKKEEEEFNKFLSPFFNFLPSLPTHD